MENGIFARLSTESHNDLGSSHFDIGEDVLSEEAYVEALNIASEVRADIGAMEQAQVAVDRLEAQIATESRMLETPESISSSTVMLAQESLATTAALLGASIGHTISHEAAVANPVSALTVSHEGVKDFLKKVIESIKGIFRKIGLAIKKLYVKVVVAMAGTKKKAEKLRKNWDKNKGSVSLNSTRFDVKESKQVYGRFATLIALVGEKNTVKFCKDIEGTYNTAQNELMAFANAVASATNAKLEELAKLIEEGNKAKINKYIQESMTELLNIGGRLYKTYMTAQAKLKELLENKFGYNEPSSFVGDLHIFPLIIRGTSVKIVEVYKVDDEATEYTIKYKKLSANKSEIFEGETKYPILSKNDIDALFEVSIALASNVKKVQKFGEKIISDGDKALDKMAKETEGSYILNKLKSGQATKRRDFTTNLTLDFILAYVGWSKDILAFTIDNVKKYGIGEM